MFEEIGAVLNHAEPESLQHLALFKDSISQILLRKGEEPSDYFSPEYSHYIVVHTPLDMEPSVQNHEWSRRFSSRCGVSIVERITGRGGSRSANGDGNEDGDRDGPIYVRGLMAAKGSKVYAILPYTHIDLAASKGASFPEFRPVSTRNRIWPEILPEIAGDKILDVGCGFGRLTLDVAEQNQGSQVFGIDVYDPLTAQARMNADALGIRNVDFRTASAYALPFEAGSFETVYSFFMLHHLEDIPKGLSEIRRVLACGGRYLAAEPLGHHHGPNYSGGEWLGIFEEAGLSAEAEEKEGAVIIRARKG
ncbi:class I SAM-dependent methyltransferase [Candidatus Methanocrinis natronophilus]|uniref:Class I SAM-dependent methyltransferase n=1 Tax=Candidatus Methanocrinis natronophilus TaxID=3033396 RepID=A0ABT5X8P1_9EURY|nr:class I SAM-dependent methyltransferase [Candidatus Methanocrinis natronophilus]MDF0591075.1 class I SAM-dependent methyltransferase [Candidatus Methanocrinis natronophilus]